MVLSYYPGCTLKTKAKDLDACGRNAAKALGLELVELSEWQCCGGVYPMARDEIVTKLSSVRALASAQRQGRDLVTLCSACHHVLKRVNNDIKTSEDIRTKVNNYLKPEIPYAGETKVIHYLELIRDQIGFGELKKKVVNPLKGKKIGAYYGCLLLRPGKVMDFDNPENPSLMEEFIKALGAQPVLYPFRNECCGGYISVGGKELAEKKCGAILSSASEKGADMLITACPLCLYNLETNAGGKSLPVYYFTQLLAEALGVGVGRGITEVAVL